MVVHCEVLVYDHSKDSNGGCEGVRKGRDWSRSLGPFSIIQGRVEVQYILGQFCFSLQLFSEPFLGGSWRRRIRSSLDSLLDDAGV